ncbi:hypothetical protein J5N97_004052 [Dioscorea zingiberensis]|uniref:Actin-related protein n=1 Tax=Dioscorea zingiberensis TaxID=325984 RepID=A0A9D5HR91_9LILI|nr:hypothetical protein J5N97_004052 [Dioscorea zingiberensis]
MMSSVVVLDNGGGLCKAGFGGERDPAAVVPNCLGRSAASKKWLVADQLQAPDADVTSVSVRRPLDRGYLVNPDLQREVWDRVLRSLLRADPAHSSLLLVEPLFNPPSIQRTTDELIFEDFGFRSLAIATLSSTAAFPPPTSPPSSKTSTSTMASAGSTSTARPSPTTSIKELILYRSINVMNETLIVDHAKEQLCFVSLDVPRDLQLARKSGKDNPFKCTYVLPDGVTHTKGYVKDMGEAQRFLSLPYGTIKHPVANGELDFQENGKNLEDRRQLDLTKNEFSLTNERFLVPEMIFHPSDLGMDQAGLAECIVRAVQSCHPHLPLFLTGGSTLFPQFRERLERELRPLVRDDYKLKITTQEEYCNSSSCFLMHVLSLNYP